MILIKDDEFLTFNLEGKSTEADVLAAIIFFKKH